LAVWAIGIAAEWSIRTSLNRFFSEKIQKLIFSVLRRHSTNLHRRGGLAIHHHPLTHNHALLDLDEQVTFINAGESTPPVIQQLSHGAAQLATEPTRKHAIWAIGKEDLQPNLHRICKFPDMPFELSQVQPSMFDRPSARITTVQCCAGRLELDRASA
jgi:hypothetical protein